MTEGIADSRHRATDAHAELYGLWADGGSGVLITGASVGPEGSRLSDRHQRGGRAHMCRLHRPPMFETSLLSTCRCAGNVMIDRGCLERPGNIAIAGPQSPEQLRALRKMAAAGTRDGCHLWMQASVPTP
jgi:2,4-dienoyl-CoA reductase-like NADH-dependent reductase (Old Yellow Enzyme family)